MAEVHPDLLDYLRQFTMSGLRATWSCAEDSGSFVSTLTAHVGTAFQDTSGYTITIADKALKVLEESVGRAVSLSLGDVAMEVEFTESETEDSHQTETFSLIFGDYSKFTYASLNNGSVFHLVRVVEGPPDFSFLQQCVRLGKMLPVEVEVEWWISPERKL